MLDQNFIGELRYVVAAASLDPVARSKVADWLADLDDAVADVDQHPALPFRIVAKICTAVYDEIIRSEIAAIRAGRGLPPMATAAGDANVPLRAA